MGARRRVKRHEAKLAVQPEQNEDDREDHADDKDALTTYLARLEVANDAVIQATAQCDRAWADLITELKQKRVFSVCPHCSIVWCMPDPPGGTCTSCKQTVIDEQSSFLNLV